MESSLISGPMMSLIGVSTVFVVLVSLVAVVSAMARYFHESAPAKAGAGPSVPDSGSDGQADNQTDSQAEAASDEPVDDLLAVALATFAYHRSRRAVSTAPPQATDWSSAGRARQIANFRR